MPSVRNHLPPQAILREHILHLCEPGWLIPVQGNSSDSIQRRPSTERTTIGLLLSPSPLQHDCCTTTHPALSRAFIELSIPNLGHLHMYTMPKCAAATAAEASLHVHATGHALRRQRLHYAHDITSTSIQILKGHTECAIMEPQLQRLVERGGG